MSTLAEARRAFRVADAYAQREAQQENAVCLEVSADLVRTRLPAVMEEYPLLNDSGWGMPRGREPFDLQKERDDLLRYADNIAAAVCWLCSLEATGWVVDSYTLKHIMEDDAGVYVANGEMIAAALIAGLPVILDDFNPLVGAAA